MIQKIRLKTPSFLNFDYFCAFEKRITKMKKIIVLLAVFFLGLAVLSACDTQHKCAAYGHYSYYQPQDTPEE